MKVRSILWLHLAILIALVPASLARTIRDWPQWRGPDQNLTSLGNEVFTGEFGLETAWKIPLGSGYSSISVVGERAVTMYSDGESDYLVALDAASGKEVWRYSLGATYTGHSGSDDGPLGTPTVHDGVVYALGPKGQLAAVKLADGEELWSQQIDEAFEAVAPFYGFTTVPIVAGGHLVVQTGGPDGRSISALDLKTGEVRWSVGDDPVGYHSPLEVELGGRRQLLAMNRSHLLGLDPASGEELWRFRYNEEEDNESSQPVVFDDKILLTFRRESALFDVVGKDGEVRLEEVWRSRALRNPNVVPIHHEGYLYGYAGRFLTCVDAATGEMAWKSRPPGFGGLILIDGHLVNLADDGHVVVAAADPAGYVEKSRLLVSDAGSFTPPSFAGGRLYVRNLTDVAAIRVTDRPTAESRPLVAGLPELKGEFGEFIRGLDASDSKAEKIDEYMAAQERFPIVEGDSLVHFVYRGDAEDLALSGNFLLRGTEETLHRVPGSDFFFRSYELTPGAHFEYRFGIFDERIPDPLNPDTLGPEGRESSVLTMPGWNEPEHLREPEGERGKVQQFQWRSKILENERELSVYLPPGYQQSEESYPLMVVNYGAQALEEGLMANSLDNLVGDSVRPVVAVFVPRVDFDEYGPRVEQFSEAVADELLGQMEEHYRILPGAENRAIMGIASGGFGSTFAAFKRPDVIGKVAVQSFYFREAKDELQAMIAAEEKPGIEFYVEWSINDLKGQGDTLQCERDSRELAMMLEEHGYTLTKNEVVDGAGWGSWRARTDKILEVFFPHDG